MNRKDRPLWRRVFATICAFTLIGAGGYVFFTGLSVLSGIIILFAVASIATPVVLIDGGSILEILVGVAEAFFEGLMGVLDAISGIFNF